MVAQQLFGRDQFLSPVIHLDENVQMSAQQKKDRKSGTESFYAVNFAQVLSNANLIDAENSKWNQVSLTSELNWLKSQT